MKTCEKKPYTITSINDLDIDNLSSTPDYFLGVRTLVDESTGTVKSSPVRVPGERVMPTGNLANVTTLEKNNTAITVPENQVRAGYVELTTSSVVLHYADAGHKAQFLMLGDYVNGMMLVQSSGFLNIPAGHKYIVGRQYYTSANGVPTTNSASGQKLFLPLSATTLLINGDF